MKPSTIAALLFASTVCSLIQALPPGRAQDVGKRSIERPIEGLIRGGSAPIGPKGTIEPPIEGVIRRSAPTLPYNSSSNAPVMNQRMLYRSLPKGGIETPLEGAIRQRSAPTLPYNSSARALVVTGRMLYRPKADEARPGLVHWLPNFETACGTSAQSGKPVLLFQMMGNLNEEFC